LTRQRLFQTGMTMLFAATLAAGAGKTPVGSTPPPVGNAVPGQLLIRESFGNNAWTFLRPTGGKGVLQPVGNTFSGIWAEFPSNAKAIWSTPGEDVQTWKIGGTGMNPKEDPSPFQLGGYNCVASIMNNPSGTTNPAALLPFSPPSIPYEVSLDLLQWYNDTNDWFAVGFTSSNAVNHNFESNGQAWMRVRMDAVQVGAYRATLELHTDGVQGATVSSSVILGGFDTLTVRYDPVNHTVTGLFNGVSVGTLSYTAAGINHVGFEAAATVMVFSADNFLVKASQ
jgi:hypothetical protein